MNILSLGAVESKNISSFATYGVSIFVPSFLSEVNKPFHPLWYFGTLMRVLFSFEVIPVIRQGLWAAVTDIKDPVFHTLTNPSFKFIPGTAFNDEGKTALITLALGIVGQASVKSRLSQHLGLVGQHFTRKLLQECQFLPITSFSNATNVWPNIRSGASAFFRLGDIWKTSRMSEITRITWQKGVAGHLLPWVAQQVLIVAGAQFVLHNYIIPYQNKLISRPISNALVDEVISRGRPSLTESMSPLTIGDRPSLVRKGVMGVVQFGKEHWAQLACGYVLTRLALYPVLKSLRENRKDLRQFISEVRNMLIEEKRISADQLELLDSTNIINQQMSIIMAILRNNNIQQ
jgi:hypothetical protein